MRLLHTSIHTLPILRCYTTRSSICAHIFLLYFAPDVNYSICSHAFQATPVASAGGSIQIHLICFSFHAGRFRRRPSDKLDWLAGESVKLAGEPENHVTLHLGIHGSWLSQPRMLNVLNTLYAMCSVMRQCVGCDICSPFLEANVLFPEFTGKPLSVFLCVYRSYIHPGCLTQNCSQEKQKYGFSAGVQGG